jgi:hypothetical protein
VCRQGGHRDREVCRWGGNVGVGGWSCQHPAWTLMGIASVAFIELCAVVVLGPAISVMSEEATACLNALIHNQSHGPAYSHASADVAALLLFRMCWA